MVWISFQNMFLLSSSFKSSLFLAFTITDERLLAKKSWMNQKKNIELKRETGT